MRSFSPTRIALHALLVALLASAVSTVGAQTITPAGSGSYYSDTPPGSEVPVNGSNAAVLPRTAPGFIGAPPTNKWWSTLIWQRDAATPYGVPMHPNPLAMQATATGLSIAMPTAPVFNATDYYYQYNNSTRAMTIGVAGMSGAALSVASAGDWSVTARWTAAGRTLDATFGRGLPFVYATVTGGNAQITFNTTGAPTIFANRGNVLGLTIGGVPYAIFGPTGATWTFQNNVATSTLAGQNYFSVAGLPAATTAALDLYQAHAFAFVTNTRASWSYDVANSVVNASFDVDTVAKEGTQTVPLIGLFRHQWINSTLPTTSYSLATARGQMKLAEASTFSCAFPFHGLIPRIPDVGAISATDLRALLDPEYAQPVLNSATDTYGSGRSYGRIAQLVHLADQSGHTAAKTRFLEYLKSELSDWLSAGATGNGRDAYQTIEAESFNQSQGVTTGPITGGSAVFGFTDNSFVRFNGVNFGVSAPTGLKLQYASTTNGSGLFEARIDSINGPVVASGGVGSTVGGAWTQVSLGANAPVANTVSGVHDVYLTCHTPYTGELFRLDSFRFENGSQASSRFFAYNQNWHTLIGYPASYGSSTEINDHHFHWGYFIFAAATVAQYDPAWAANIGPMVKLLIRDAANADRADTTFPYLRNFDPYVGHSQASGHAAFASGNNQESSSEAMNFATAVILWGAATNDAATRDLGIYLYASEAASIEQYWLDADNAVYPAAAPKKFAGIVWDSGIAYATWFSAEPEHIHGINFLPITPGSFYLGARPDSIVKSWNIMTATRGGPPTLWQSVHYSTLALANPAQANTWLTANPGFNPDGGDSKSQMVQWIRSLGVLGTIDTTVHADTPYYAVFSNAGTRRYIAWNPLTVQRTVRFSDGYTLCVAPGATAYSPASTPATICPCRADYNLNGVVAVQDIFDFLADWFLQAPRSDTNGDGTFALQDIFDFLNIWFTGCP
jgi:endoglucanase Acf2